MGRFFGRPDPGAPAGQSVERGFDSIIHRPKPGATGRARFSPVPREKGSAELFILTQGYGECGFKRGYKTKIQWARLLWRDDLARLCNDIHKGWAFLSYSWARRVAPLLLTWIGGESNTAHLWKVGVFVRLLHINRMRCISTLFSVMLSNCCASSPSNLCRDRNLGFRDI